MKGGFREGLPTVLGELQRVSVDELSDALNNAIDKFIAPASLRDLLDNILLDIPNVHRDELISFGFTAELAGCGHCCAGPHRRSRGKGQRTACHQARG